MGATPTRLPLAGDAGMDPQPSARPPAGLTVQVLGGFQVQVDGRPIPDATAQREAERAMENLDRVEEWVQRGAERSVPARQSATSA